MKKLWSFIALVVILVPMLAACDGGEDATDTPKATEVIKATEPVVEEFTCTDALGCVDVAAGDPIRIAYSFVVSGPDESLGTDTKRGVEMALEDRGQVLGRDIELVGEDSQCNAEGGQAAAQKLAADPKVVAVIGTNCSSAARAAVPILSEAGLVIISPSNTALDLTDPEKHIAGYARTCHSDIVQGAVAAEFAYEFMGATKAATIHDGSLYADQLQQVFVARFTELGGEITAQEAIQPTDTDMRPMLTRVASTEPEFIYYPIFIAAGGFVTAQAKETPGLEDVYLMGADGMFSPDFLEAAGESSVGMYHSSPDFGAFGDAYLDFLAEHETKYGEAPLAPFHAHAYDAAMIILDAVEKVGVIDAEGTLHVGRQALRDAVFSTADYQGLTGNLTCSEYGDCGAPVIAVYETFDADPASWNPGSSEDNNPRKIYPGVEAPEAGPPAGATTISIWHQWSGDYLNTIEEVFAEYMAANPDVYIDLSKPEDTSNALSVAIPAGEGPDIIGWANDQIGTQALVGNIVALDEHGIDMNFLESTYEPAAVRGVVWQDMIWGLPESQEGIAFVYNKAMVDETYLPTDPTDFDALLEKAKAFYEETGKYLVCNQGLGNSDAYHVAPIYFGFGVPEYVDDGGNAYMNTPEAIAAAEWLVQFSQYAPAETSHDICKAMIVDGDAAAWWTGPWAIADLESAGIDYGIIPMGRPFVGIKTLMLSANAVDRGNVEIALDIMKYFTSAEVQTKLALANKTIPAPTGAVQNPDVQALTTLAGFGASLNLGVPMANTPYAGAQWGPVGDATTALWTGAQAPEEAMNGAQEAIEAAIADMQ